MTGRPDQTHPSAEKLQAFLDGALPQGERGPVEEHLASCARCAAEAAGWSQLYQELAGLPRAAPLEGFADRVMADVQLPQPKPVAARLREVLEALAWSRHPADGRMQDWIDGTLPETAAARVASHVEGCTRCAGEASALRALVGQLDGLGHVAPREDFAADVLQMHALLTRVDGLGHLAPSAGFAARVMAEVATRPAPAWGRLLAAARGLVPSTRKAWAAISGVAVTPAVTLGLVVWAVFSHPTITAGALASFAWWKVTDAAMWAWNATASTLVESAGVFRLYSVLEALAGAPGMLALGFLVFSVGTLASMWVLYKNLFVAHPVEGRYVHASL